MFNNFVNHTLSTEYHLFNKTGCKFTVTNVYFKKENDIILKGALWKEAESQSTPRASPAITKNAPPLVPARPAPGRPQRVIYCRKCIHLLYNENKFEKYIDMHFYTGT